MGLGDGISVITVTNKGNCLLNLIQNYKRQKLQKKELIIIINNDAIEEAVVEKLCINIENVSIGKVPQTVSLGQCLNIAGEKAKYGYIAKFDDDDYYGEYYLHEALHVLSSKGCHIVCKSNIFYYLKAYGELLVLPSLCMDFKKTRTGAGATICMKKETLKVLPFADIRKGVDLDLFTRARKLGLDLYTSTSYNFLCIRSENLEEHTWKIAPEALRCRGERNFGIRKMSLEEACHIVSQYPIGR